MTQLELDMRAGMVSDDARRDKLWRGLMVHFQGEIDRANRWLHDITYGQGPLGGPVADIDDPKLHSHLLEFVVRQFADLKGGRRG